MTPCLHLKASQLVSGLVICSLDSVDTNPRILFFDSFVSPLRLEVIVILFTSPFILYFLENNATEKNKPDSTLDLILYL